MSEHTTVTLDTDGPVARVTFRTANGINVASVEFLEELETALERLAEHDEVRYVVFQAEGKVFLAGANIKAMSAYTADQARDMAERGHRVFDRIEALPQVSVAAIHGACLGGGLELALACDFRFAVKTANMGSPEVLLGLIPGWGGTRRLARVVPLGQARRLMISGDTIKAEQGERFGLLDGTVNSPEDLAPFIRAFLDGLGKAGPQAVAAVKRALSGADEIAEFVSCFGQQECREGMAAFLERRPAAWSK